MNMIITSWRFDSEVIVGSNSKSSRQDFPYEFGCLPSRFNLPLLVFIQDVASLGVDELWGNADLDQVFHDLAKGADATCSPQVRVELAATHFAVLRVFSECLGQLFCVRLDELALVRLADIWNVTVQFRHEANLLDVLIVMLRGHYRCPQMIQSISILEVCQDHAVNCTCSTINGVLVLGDVDALYD